MLDMGFAEDLEAILQATPAEKQTALFSATMPARIAAIAGRHLKDPARITIARERTAAGKVPRVRQVAYIVSRAHKPLALGRVLEVESPSAALVFCRTRLEVDELVETLSAHGYRCEALHGGMVQKQRDRVMGLFRAQKVDLLVATDVAARGLDIEHLSHVVNYDVPSAAEAYVHRIGRTGRIGRAGVAITLAEPREQRLLRNIEAFTKQKIEVQSVPTVADLRSRRLELMQATLRERLLAGDSDDVRVVVESLAGEFDLVQIASAALKLAMLADGRGEEGREERDIPPVELKPHRHEDAGERGGEGRAPKKKGPRPGAGPADGPPVRRGRPCRGRAAGRPRRRDHGRDRPRLGRRRLDRDQRPLLDRRGPEGPREGDRDRAARHQAARPEGQGRPRPRLALRGRQAAYRGTPEARAGAHLGVAPAQPDTDVVPAGCRRLRRDAQQVARAQLVQHALEGGLQPAAVVREAAAARERREAAQQRRPRAHGEDQGVGLARRAQRARGAEPARGVLAVREHDDDRAARQVRRQRQRREERVVHGRPPAGGDGGERAQDGVAVGGERGAQPQLVREGQQQRLVAAPQAGDERGGGALQLRQLLPREAAAGVEHQQRRERHVARGHQLDLARPAVLEHLEVAGLQSLNRLAAAGDERVQEHHLGRRRERERGLRDGGREQQRADHRPASAHRAANRAAASLWSPKPSPW